jgi:hypothetical protein
MADWGSIACIDEETYEEQIEQTVRKSGFADRGRSRGRGQGTFSDRGRGRGGFDRSYNNYERYNDRGRDYGREDRAPLGVPPGLGGLLASAAPTAPAAPSLEHIIYKKGIILTMRSDGSGWTPVLTNTPLYKTFMGLMKVKGGPKPSQAGFLGPDEQLHNVIISLENDELVYTYEDAQENRSKIMYFELPESQS